LVADAGPAVTELVGDRLAKMVVLGPQLGDDGARGLQLLTKRLGACLFSGGTAMAAD